MLDNCGNVIKRKRKPRIQYSPSSTNNFSSSPSQTAMSTPITTSPPCSTSLPKETVVLPSQPINDEINDDIEALISELPTNTKDGKNFKKFLTLTRKALVKDFTRILNEQISSLKAENDALKSHVKNLENQIKNNVIEYQTDINRLEQYGRRSNIEIAGIPDEIPLKELEGKVVEILTEIDVQVDDRDIEACHRLPKGRFGKGPARTIVRFVNRKNCEKIFSKKRNLKNIDKKKLKLGNNNIYINHSLCRDYRRIWNNARKLFNDGKITSFWVSNGTVRIALSEDSPPISILHRSKLEELFSGYDLDGPITNGSNF